MCLPACSGYSRPPHRPFRAPLCLPITESITPSLPCSTTHTYRPSSCKGPQQMHIKCACRQIHVLEVAQFGAKWEQEVVKRLKGCRAWWVKEGIHLYISLALMLLRTSSVFVSQSPTLSMYLSLRIHIYCRNTVEVWGLHHRCSRGLRMAEWERKGMDCQNPKPLICHAYPQGPLKRQWRHLK